MSTESNKALVRRLFEEVVNQRNLALIDEIIAEDIVIHTPVPGVRPGRESFRQFLDVFLSAFPVQHAEVEDVIAEADQVAVLHTHRVEHTGAFIGAPPTGRKASVPGIEVFRVAGGQIAEMWHQDDLLGLMQQLGLAPGPATEP
jgi:steroid delta-isomerase-like uncharacterized protein